MKANRREFLSQSSKIAAVAGFGILMPEVTRASGKKIPANEKIVIGLIGARNMGFGILKHALNQPEVECAAIADIDDSILSERSAEVEKIQGKKPGTYKDYRKLLEDKSIDAVIVGTPDHWHCLAMVHACEAGKDVYVEKPMANSIGECIIMQKAARKYKSVVQVGQQQRSGKNWNDIMDFIKSGKIGQLRKVQIWGNFNYGVGRPVVPDEPVPEGVDFNTWLGPAPDRSFNPSRFHGSWRMFWDYGGGLMTDWGVHLIDMALWAGDVTTPPIAANAVGGNYSHPDNAHETFDTMAVTYQLNADYTISWEHTAGTQNGPYEMLYGLSFVGNDATIVAERGSWKLYPEKEDGKYKVPAIPNQGGHENHENHVKNFLECIKTRKDPNCTVETGKNVAMYAHLGNIALRTGSQIKWNDNAQNFGDNEAANAYIWPDYRKPWKLPKP